MLQLQWIKSKADTWLEFETFNLPTAWGFGVYIIWHAGSPSRTVYVGQGDVKARLGVHRSNGAICGYAKNGTLRVTWASVSVSQRDGVERYLANLLHPLVGDAHPDVQPIAVNSPWS